MLEFAEFAEFACLLKATGRCFASIHTTDDERQWKLEVAPRAPCALGVPTDFLTRSGQVHHRLSIHDLWFVQVVSAMLAYQQIDEAGFRHRTLEPAHLIGTRL